MGIETTKGAGAGAYTPQQDQATFGGATINEGGVPHGKLDFLSLSSRIGMPMIDQTIEPFLDRVMAIVKQSFGDAKIVTMDHSTSSYAVQITTQAGIKAFSILVFTSADDTSGGNLYPVSARIQLVYDELKRKFPNEAIHIVEERVLISGWAGDMNRHVELASNIIKGFNVTTDPTVRDATISSLLGTEFEISWSLNEARAFERSISSHGVAARMDVGMVLKVKLRNTMNIGLPKELETEYRTIGVIGGFTELRGPERVALPNGSYEERFRPVFNITTLMSTIPLPGVAAILIAAFSRAIYQQNRYSSQWYDLSADRPYPGLLIPDPDKPTQPFKLSNREELAQFIKTYFTDVVLALHIQDGRDSIPGVRRLFSSDASEKADLLANLARFFETQIDLPSAPSAAAVFETRYEGAYGNQNGELHDSRDIDYLYLAAAKGMAAMTDDVKHVLVSGTTNPQDRAKLVKYATVSFNPLWLTTAAMFNPDFLTWVANQCVNNRLNLADPEAQAETNSITSFMGNFGSAANIPSMITNMPTRGGFNIPSYWNGQR